eukprot:m.261336 g.261336  ORF g.261336 m.261336 type:complete len:1041 (-) comp24528_c0_seq1:600-3722(-)
MKPADSRVLVREIAARLNATTPSSDIVVKIHEAYVDHFLEVLRVEIGRCLLCAVQLHQLHTVPVGDAGLPIAYEYLPSSRDCRLHISPAPAGVVVLLRNSLNGCTNSEAFMSFLSSASFGQVCGQSTVAVHRLSISECQVSSVEPDAMSLDNDTLGVPLTFGNACARVLRAILEPQSLNLGNADIILGAKPSRDGSRLYGVSLATQPSTAVFKQQLEIATNSLFPPLPAEADLNVDVIELRGSSVHDWCDEALVFCGDLDPAVLNALLIVCDGRASIAWSHSVGTLVQPVGFFAARSALQAAAERARSSSAALLDLSPLPSRVTAAVLTIINSAADLAVWRQPTDSDADCIDLSSRRYALRVRLRGIPAEQRVFVDKSTTAIPILSAAGPVSMDPCAAWLRVCAARPFEAQLANALLSGLSLCFMLVEAGAVPSVSAQSMLRACSNGLGCLPALHQVEVPSTTLRFQSHRLMPKFIMNPHVHRVAVVPACLILTLCDWIRADQACYPGPCTPRYTVVIMIPSASLLTEGLGASLSARLRQLWSIRGVTVADARLAMDSPLFSNVSVFPSGTAAGFELPTTSFNAFDVSPARLGLASTTADAQCVAMGKDWLLGRTCSGFPAWELVQHGFVVRLKQHQLIVSKIDAALQEQRTSIQVFSIRKTQTGSGATAMARAVAFQLRDRAHILWVLATPMAGDFAAQLRIAARDHGGRVLVVVDDHLSVEDVQASLARAMRQLTPEPFAVSLLYVNTSRQVAVRANEVAVSPFLELVEFKDMVGQLKAVVCERDPESGLTTMAALDAAFEEAAQPGAPLYYRHMLIIGLVAARGLLKPIDQWMTGLHGVLVGAAPPTPSSPALTVISITLAFMSAFCRPGRRQLPMMHACLDWFPVAMPSFWELFVEAEPPQPAVDDLSPTRCIACIHPFIARLFLSKCFPSLDFVGDRLPLTALVSLFRIVKHVLVNMVTPHWQQRALLKIFTDHNHDQEEFSHFVAAIVDPPILDGPRRGSDGRTRRVDTEAERRLSALIGMVAGTKMGGHDSIE